MNNEINNIDFIAFKAAESRVIKATDTLDFFQTEFELSPLFQSTFPQLSALLKTARVLHFNINDQPYRLLSWTLENESRGWLCTLENNEETKLPLIAEHRLLLKEMGGIFTTYNDGDINLSNGQKFMFTASRCSLGIDGWDNFYNDRCAEDDLSDADKIDYSAFIVFVQDASGDVTTYDPHDKTVMQFNHNGDFKDRSGANRTALVDQQPEDTFYRLKGVNSFVDYVAMLAHQWLNFEE